MQSRFLVAFAVLLALPGCGEDIQAQNQPQTLPGEIGASDATEGPRLENKAEAPETEVRDPVEFD